jgi:nucleoside-diphosphate-sugar epimerase
MDSSKIQSLGWRPKITLREGITATYELYRKESLLA